MKDEYKDMPGEVVRVQCDCGKPALAVVEGEQGQRISWYCPHCTEFKSDVNA